MKLKPAFNLAELMIFLIVVSIILSIIFAVVKPKQAVSDKTVRYRYAAAYDALNMALYDLMAESSTNPFVSVSESESSGFQKLCKGLTSYINTESENCTNPPLSQSVSYMRNEDTDFRNIKPHFTSLNGMNFYLSDIIRDDVVPNTNRSYYNAEKPDFTLEFFMVYVDLNGQENLSIPHSIKYDNTGKTHPKVFAFALLPTGDAIPIGVAEYNIKYLQTRVSYKDNTSIYYSPYYSYHNAKHAAWNWYLPGNVNNRFIERMSFTYNDYVKEILIRHGSELYKFNNGNTFPRTYTKPMFAKCNPPAGTALTVYDICNLTVDTPNYGAVQ